MRDLSHAENKIQQPAKYKIDLNVFIKSPGYAFSKYGLVSAGFLNLPFDSGRKDDLEFRFVQDIGSIFFPLISRPTKNLQQYSHDFNIWSEC